MIDGKKRLVVIVDRPKVEESSRALGQSSSEETRGAGLSTLGWESGPGSVLVLLTDCVTLGKSLGPPGCLVNSWLKGHKLHCLLHGVIWRIQWGGTICKVIG